MLSSYQIRRKQIEVYFDQTAVEAWKRLTSTAPVGSIRATVRAGRDQMRQTLLDWLPVDLRGKRLLDAGCGTGALAVEAARRGADVTAIDLSPTLVALARDRAPQELLGAGTKGKIDFVSGDMLDPALGQFDHVVGMDSLIHYQPEDVVRALSELAPRTRTSMIFTFAPSNPALATMIALGRLLPRGDRAPSIVPVRETALRRLIVREQSLSGWKTSRTKRISSGFYKSQALELAR
jgi:magnesium-protoporphyrin O-methyltransferase